MHIPVFYTKPTQHILITTARKPIFNICFKALDTHKPNTLLWGMNNKN